MLSSQRDTTRPATSPCTATRRTAASAGRSRGREAACRTWTSSTSCRCSGRCACALRRAGRRARGSRAQGLGTGLGDGSVQPYGGQPGGAVPERRTPARQQQTHSRRAQRPARGRGASAARRPRATVRSEPGPPGPAPSSVCGGRTASSCPPGHQGAAVTCAGSRSRSDQGAEPPPRAVTPGSRGSPGRPPALALAGSGPLRALKQDSGGNSGKAFKTGTRGRFPFYCFPRTT